MPLEAEPRVVRIHPDAVVFDANEFLATVFDGDRQARGAGVEGVLDELLDDARRPLDHLAGGDAVDHGFVEAADRHREIPSALWHSLVFYTAGEWTRRNLAAHGVEYRPWGFDAHLYQGDFEPVARHWQAPLDGRLGLEEAIAKVVADQPPNGK